MPIKLTLIFFFFFFFLVVTKAKTEQYKKKGKCDSLQNFLAKRSLVNPLSNDYLSFKWNSDIAVARRKQFPSDFMEKLFTFKEKSNVFLLLIFSEILLSQSCEILIMKMAERGQWTQNTK